MFIALLADALRYLSGIARPSASVRKKRTFSRNGAACREIEELMQTPKQMRTDESCARNRKARSHYRMRALFNK
jgi:hypothetical protein